MFLALVGAGFACCVCVNKISVVANPPSYAFSCVTKENGKNGVYTIKYKSTAKDIYMRAVVAKVLYNRFEEKLGNEIEGMPGKDRVYDVLNFKDNEALVLYTNSSSANFGADILTKIKNRVFLGANSINITVKEFSKALDEIILDIKSIFSKFSKLKKLKPGEGFVFPNIFKIKGALEERGDTYYSLILAPILDKFFPGLKLKVGGSVRKNLPEYSAKFLRCISKKACDLLKIRFKEFKKLKNAVKKSFSVSVGGLYAEEYSPAMVYSTTPLDVSDFAIFLPDEGASSYTIDELLAVSACVFSLYKNKYSKYVKHDLNKFAKLSKFEIPKYCVAIAKVIKDISRNCSLSSKISKDYVEDLAHVIDYIEGKIKFGALKNISQLKLLNPTWLCNLYKIFRDIASKNNNKS